LGYVAEAQQKHAEMLFQSSVRLSLSLSLLLLIKQLAVLVAVLLHAGCQQYTACTAGQP